MKYRSRQGTVINIPDGLTAKQVSQIKADADAGYGNRAQKTANQLGKKVGKQVSNPTESGSSSQQVDPSISENVVDPQTGTIDPVATSQSVNTAEQKDITNNFNLSQPNQVDQFGNRLDLSVDPVTGKVTRSVTAGEGVNKFKDLALEAASTFNGDVSRENAYNAEFARRTKYLDRNRAREEENLKQELANRGIPYNPSEVYNENTKNLYGRTLGNLKQNYDSQYADAANQATLAANQAYATDASVRDSFIQGALQGVNTLNPGFGQYQNTVQTDQSGDTKELIALSAKQYADKYGITVQEALEKKRIAATSANRGGSSSKQSSGGGFEI